MKRTTTLLLSLLLTCTMGFVQAQINIPAPSPSGSVSSTVGLTNITIDYFRPGVKGRKIFGEGSDYLQPYGTLWRTGANTGTVLKLSTDATIAGTKVPAGEYLIFTIPGAETWRFMLYDDLSIGGNTAAYNTEHEVLNVELAPKKTSKLIERLTFQITDISADNTSAMIHMAWENTALDVPVTVDFDEIVMADIASKTHVNPNNYVAAANYYYATDRDLEQALEWINKGIEADPNAFWNIHLKAQILAKMGRKEEAIAAATTSMETAKASGNDFGYVKRNQELIDSLK